MIVRNAKWNKIDKIMKKTEKIKMQIIKHEKKIMFNEMKMSKHKIMLEMNWLWKHNSRIDWKWKMIMMKNCECKIRQMQIKLWTEVKKQISQQYWEYKKLFTKSSEN